MTTGSSDFFIGYNIPNILSGLSVFTRYGSSPLALQLAEGKKEEIFLGSLQDYNLGLHYDYHLNKKQARFWP